MAELQIDFRSYDEWSNWAAINKQHFDSWRQNCLEMIRKNGIEELFTNLRRLPSELLINEENLRESISCGGLNSRKRACMYGLELGLELLNDEQRQSPRILAAESLTAAARVLNYKFPYFVGGEYLPTRKQQEQFFPIKHLDIQQIDYPASSFDVFYSADVLEFVPDIRKCFNEIIRVLRPGGIMVSTFRFSQNMPTNQVRAELKQDGAICHLMAPQYVQNLIDPEIKDLVYTIPGWEIIEIAKKAGFEDAKFTYIVSAKHGILNGPQPGVFVFSAVKALSGEERKYLKTRHRFQAGAALPAPNSLIGLIGLPRSGTTMLASIFSVHHQINSVYEPWNARKSYVMDNICLHGFYNVLFDSFEKNKPVLLVKETSTKPLYVQRMKRLMDSAGLDNRKFIVLLRNPFHIYLSEMEARVKWWGNTQAPISTETFDAWALRSVRSVFRMLALAERYNGLLISYEHLTACQSESLAQLMGYVEIPLDEKQLEFQHHINISKVRGDPKLIDSPTNIDATRQATRDIEFEQIEKQISHSKYYSDICLLRDYVEKLTNSGAVRYQDFHQESGIAPARYMPIF